MHATKKMLNPCPLIQVVQHKGVKSCMSIVPVVALSNPGQHQQFSAKFRTNTTVSHFRTVFIFFENCLFFSNKTIFGQLQLKFIREVPKFIFMFLQLASISTDLLCIYLIVLLNEKLMSQSSFTDQAQNRLADFTFCCKELIDY